MTKIQHSSLTAKMTANGALKLLVILFIITYSVLATDSRMKRSSWGDDQGPICNYRESALSPYLERSCV